MANSKGILFIVSAPSGTGKTTIVRRILKEFPEIVFSISATTRKKRHNEKDGVDYLFLTEDEFRNKIEAGEFAEWEKFYDYYYGTFRDYIDKNLQKGSSVLLEIDVKGALKLKECYPDAVLIFIVPPSFDELVSRLKNRQTEDEIDLKKRIERAELELRLKDKFDYFIHNVEIEKAVSDVKSLIENIIKENK
ncbi:MAG TPA: guanylate kinase [Ignavibacteriaceae bacterium]|nr:guanylate kinase [Ignavibacteriaceae bacterium]